MIQFAQASAALKGSPPCDVASHPFYEYEHSLQGLPGLHFNAGGEEEEIWLVVERLHESPAPAPKQPLLALWLDVSNNPAKEPSLKPALEFAKLLDGRFAELKKGHEPVDVKRLVLLQDFNRASELETQLKAYMATQWTPWAAEEKKRRRTIQLYGRLFTLKQQLEGSIIDAQIEIAMGVGMAVWIMAGIRVCYWTKHAYGYKVRSKSLKPLADGGQKQVAIDRSTDQLADIARKRQASGKLKHKERQRVHRLQHELKEWEASHRIRAYIASLQAAGADAKPETAQWLLWVQKYADHLDPAVDFRIEVLDMA